MVKLAIPKKTNQKKKTIKRERERTMTNPIISDYLFDLVSRRPMFWVEKLLV